MRPAEELLRGLAAADASCLDAVLSAPVTRASSEQSPGSPSARAGLGTDAVLGRQPRALVRLAALLVVDAPTPSVCWAVELASLTGITDDGLVAVLLAVISCAQTAEAELSATSLAAALDGR